MTERCKRISQPSRRLPQKPGITYGPDDYAACVMEPDGYRLDSAEEGTEREAHSGNE